jgi:hypothetical protein
LNPEPGTDQLRYKVSISIKLAAFQASGSAHMKLHLDITANRRISKCGFARAAQALAPRVAQSILNKTEYITSTFDIFYSIFDI